MANAKFKKGQEVYGFFANFSDGSVSFRKYIVHSCGVKQMYLNRVDDGSMAEFKVRAHNYGDFELCADVADPIANAFTRSAASIAGYIAYWNSKLTGSDGSTAWSTHEQGKETARHQIAKYEACVPQAFAK